MLLFLEIIIFFSVSSIAYLLLSMLGEPQKYKQSLNKLSSYEITNNEEEKNFYDRLVGPSFSLIVNKLSRFNTTKRNEHYEKLIMSAGKLGKLDTDKIAAIKIILLLVFFILSFFILITGYSFLLKLLFIIISSILGYYLPDLWLNNLAQNRQNKLRKDLPDTLDSLVICVEAGLGFDSALSKIVKHGHGPLTREFARVLYEIQVGISRKEAFKNLSERTNVEELQAFSQAIIQADTFGISASKILRSQANEIRIKAKQLAEEKAQKSGVKISIPLILCIFPAMFVVILGPALIKFYFQFLA